jgi:hypothetical protein
VDDIIYEPPLPFLGEDNWILEIPCMQMILKSFNLAQLSPHLFYSFPCFTSRYIEDDKLCHWLDLIMLDACEWLWLHNKNQIFQTLLGQTITGRKANKYDEEKRKQEEGCQAETC